VPAGDVLEWVEEDETEPTAQAETADRTT